MNGSARKLAGITQHGIDAARKSSKHAGLQLFHAPLRAMSRSDRARLDGLRSGV